ncbi:uncharacterized protein LOC110451295 [Mizuhopecten yessoensis]|uniref:uncharacterized protein LOC110451295 n=1 Tax=Mizuhopecten yessoensis TaxID=6573 RepID=UPI000B45C1BA|nr:uncharacterized protein LOC110451295 [Mizuhopecten yessoensis]
MLKHILCALVLTNIIFSKCKGTSVETDIFSIRYNGAPENANLEILHRLKTLENLRENDAKESIVMKETMESYHDILGKALNDITTLKQEFGKLQQDSNRLHSKLQQDNNRLHSRLETVMLQNDALSTQCKKRCSVAEKLGHSREPTNTFSLDRAPDTRNITSTHDSEPAEPRTLTQDTVDAKLTNPPNSKRKVIIRRSPVPFPRTQEVAEGGQGSGFFARSSITAYSVAIGHTIIFDSVITNTHNDFSGYTGAFTCSTPGLYVFIWTIQINIHYLQSQLLKNGAPVADGYAGDDRYYKTTGTSTAVLSLAQGDVIVVHVSGRATADPVHVLPHVTSFSGFLV